jgi:ribonuclease-3
METYPLPLAQLEAAVGYCFQEKSHLILALTHSSYCNEYKMKEGKSTDSNERLEFLGDSVLSFISSRYLYETYPRLPEGRLSPIRAKAVCEKTLCKLAKEIGLGDYLFLGHGEDRAQGRKRPSILADAFEALLAAMYLDGGIEPVKAFLLPRLIKEIEEIVESGADLDYKTYLQQVIQQEKGEVLEYVTIGESGPAHQKVFTVEARLNGNVIGQGSGPSKRAAEQLAAKEALKLFGME